MAAAAKCPTTSRPVRQGILPAGALTLLAGLGAIFAGCTTELPPPRQADAKVEAAAAATATSNATNPASLAPDSPPPASSLPTAATPAVATQGAAESVGGPRPAPLALTLVSDGGPKNLTFDDIKFEMEKGTPFKRELLTPKIEELFAKTIRIRGWILPQSVFTQKNIRQFVLVRDNQECCFGPGAALFDCIVVQMDEGQSTHFTTRPISVEGVFSLDELIGPDDKHLAIYHLQASRAGE